MWNTCKHRKYLPVPRVRSALSSAYFNGVRMRDSQCLGSALSVGIEPLCAQWLSIALMVEGGAKPSGCSLAPVGSIQPTKLC